MRDLIELPRWYSWPYGDERELLRATCLRGGRTARSSTACGGDEGPQVFVGRTDALRGVPATRTSGWSTTATLSSAAGRLVREDPGLVVTRARVDKEYTSYRGDVTRDAAYLSRKRQGPPVD